ncbi:MAG: DUF3347 domain-containing protein [Cyclobacteriaceae bacterium]
MKKTAIHKAGSVLLFLAASVIVSCSGNNTGSSVEKSGNASISDPNEDLIGAYIALKNDLVESNLADAKNSAGELLSASERAGLSAESLALLREMSNAGDLNEIRDAFDPLSQQVYTWAKTSDHGDQTLYWQYCPMALDNRGANWLSLEEEILNPYFGDQMLRCGNIEEEL